MAQEMKTMYNKGSLVSRCVAAFIDSIILNRLCGIMDSLNEGRGIGKNMMGIRTVDYNSGEGPSVVQSCLRNWCNLCVCLACVGEGRHVGDLIAGTIVIDDK